MADREIAFRLACVLAVGLAILHRGHFVSTDELGLYFQTHALSEELSLVVPPLNLTHPGRNGQSYSHYPIGQSLLAVPFHAAGRLIEPLLPAAARSALEGSLGGKAWGGAPPVRMGAFPILFYPPVATGVLAALFFLFERRLGASRGSALTASVVLAASTHVGTLSTLFLQHTTEAVGALGAFYFWHRFRASGAPRDVLLGSVFASSLVNVRVAGAISGLALGGYLGFAVLERLRRGAGRRWLATALLSALLPLLASAALYLLVNQLKWAAWLLSPMTLDERDRMGVDPRPALMGFLLSPGMSVFVYSPLLLLLPATLPRFLRAHRAETWTLLALFVSNLLFYASYKLWTGLFSCPGPRYLSTGVVFLMLPLGPWLDRARGLLPRAAFVALAASGAAVQLLSASVAWGDLVIREGYRSWRPAFGFLFELRTAPLAAAARLAGDPHYIDVWLARLALGWRGQEPAPGVALAVLLVWSALVLVLALRLRRAVRGAPP